MLSSVWVRRTLVTAALLVLVVLIVVAYGHQRIHGELSGVTKPVTFEVRRGDTLGNVADRLQSAAVLSESGVLSGITLYRLYSRFGPDQGYLKAGEYTIPVGVTIPELDQLLKSGSVNTYQVTFIEGWTFSDVLKALGNQPKLDHQLQGLETDAVLKALDLEISHPEGWFFPDTYQYVKGDSDIQLLRAAHAKMKETLMAAWNQHLATGRELPLKSPYETLILASIVEKETGAKGEREMIAGVFIRRLLKRMRLQTDPTVIYGMGEDYQGNISRADLRRVTPYNTYKIKGLPPTPIAMPGKASIQAVLNPDESNYLYFVAKGDGSHQFSETLKAHTRAVREYQIERRKQNYRSAPQQ
ncbi:MAG: endolytic transglycosylase MltG [Pseudomonadales bacterium]|nr:endolytic transglycosylase MltG [Pseudomonadales bacterium]